MLKHLSIYTYFLDNIFHLDVHYVCMLVQHFEPQGRRFTNFHYYYYYACSRPFETFILEGERVAQAERCGHNVIARSFLFFKIMQSKQR